jgi:competence protein ComEC
VQFVFTSDNQQKVLVTTNVFSQVQYGDKVEVLGKLKVPGIIDDGNGEKPFDYGAYLSKDDIYFTESFARVNIISSGHGNPIIAWLLKIKNAFTLKMKDILPEPESSLLAGLTISGKQALPKTIVTDFTNAGVVQIIVLSGYNVTIIAEFFLLIFSFLGIRLATGISAVGIILFTLMTGASATVVRASIMVLVFLLGKIIGRQASASRLLLFTAFLMLVQNPKILVFDPSFDLTFIAMLALIFAVPVAEKYLTKIPEKFGLRMLVATTLAIQIAVFPYLLYNVGAVSVVSLFSNALIIFVVPLTMLVGFIATFLAFISNIIAWPLSFVSHLLLFWILAVAHFFGNLSFSRIKISHFPMWLTLVLYAGLIFSVWRLHLPAQTGNSPRKSAS